MESRRSLHELPLKNNNNNLNNNNNNNDNASLEEQQQLLNDYDYNKFEYDYNLINNKYDQSFSDDHRDLVADIDADYVDNHLYCVEYIPEIFQHLQELEVKRRPSSQYMSKQREITAEMRAM